MRRAGFLVTAALMIGAVVPAPAGAIVGGASTGAGSWPWVVQVFNTSGPRHCGGALVAPTRVVTAGHCVDGGPPSSTFVVANDKVTLSGSSAVIGVSSVEFAPSYAPGTSTDVAVLTLDSAPVPATTLQVLGAGDSADFANPASGQIAGWGTTGSIGSIPPNLLQGTVTLDTVGADCIFGTRCSETGVEPCNGDIGDPVIVQIGADTVTSDPSPANGEWRLVAVPVALDSICTGATYAT